MSVLKAYKITVHRSWHVEIQKILTSLIYQLITNSRLKLPIAEIGVKLYKIINLRVSITQIARSLKLSLQLFYVKNGHKFLCIYWFKCLVIAVLIFFICDEIKKELEKLLKVTHNSLSHNS